MEVLQVVNSILAKNGNIGIRTNQINLRLVQQGHVVRCICRGNKGSQSKDNLKIHSMGIIGYIPRFLNRLRNYIPFFDHRPFDIALFNLYFLITMNLNKSYKHTKVAHVWEYSPFIINYLKNRGVKVILEIPIAPAIYAKKLNDKEEIFKVFDGHIKNEINSFKSADYLIAPSNFVKNELLKLGINESKIFTVEFGVDQNLAADIFYKKLDANNKTINKKNIKFCFAGAVNERKGIMELLDVWSNDIFQKDTLHLCGNVNVKIRKKINENKNKHNIITPGFVDIFSYLNDCDVFVFPSWMEGSSKAVFDAMSSGLPIITSFSSGTVVRDGIDGFVIEAGNKEALKAKMLWFKDNPDKTFTMGKTALEYSKKFSWEMYSKKIIKIYSNILN